MGSGEWEEAESYLRVAAEKLNEPAPAAQAWADLGRVLSDLGHEDKAEAAREQALTAGGKTPQLIARLEADKIRGGLRATGARDNRTVISRSRLKNCSSCAATEAGQQSV